jgi:hypothetical protein
MGYAWSHDGVERAIADTMRDHPELAQPFEVASMRDPQDYTWHVDLDPLGERRVARLAWELVEYGQLDAIADKLREAAPVW